MNNFDIYFYGRVLRTFILRTQWHDFDLELSVLAKIKFNFIKLSTVC
jgi:hypothetical protein